MTRSHVAGDDLFGQVQITSHDIFAWLLCVPRIDPASPQAGNYVRGYDVLQKIGRAKADGSFDDVMAQAQQNSRFLQLLEQGLPEQALADLFAPRQLPTVKLRGERVKLRRWRSKDVIRAERARLAVEKEERRRGDMSLLCRLPAGVPSLSRLLSEIGSPSAFYLARAMQVPVVTAELWIHEDQAPHSVMLALFWLTRWGVSIIDAEAHNSAVLQAQLAASSQAETADLRAAINRVERIADFGSANDPLSTVRAGRVNDAEPPSIGYRSGGALGANALQGGEATGGPGGCNPLAGERFRRGPEASSGTSLPAQAENQPRRSRACAA